MICTTMCMICNQIPIGICWNAGTYTDTHLNQQPNIFPLCMMIYLWEPAAEQFPLVYDNVPMGTSSQAFLSSYMCMMIYPLEPAGSSQAFLSSYMYMMIYPWEPAAKHFPLVYVDMPMGMFSIFKGSAATVFLLL